MVMASFILATMSKKSRMPDLGRLTTCLAMKRDWSMKVQSKITQPSAIAD